MRFWEVAFGGLSNSLDESQVPDGKSWSAVNASAERGIVEGAKRFGDEWARTSAHAGDVGLGFFGCEFGSAAEYLAIIKHNGETTARLYSINPATGVFTQVTNAGGGGEPDPQALEDSARYQFVQYEDTVYICIDDGSQQMLKRVVGAANGTGDALKYFTPTYNRGAGFGLEITNDYVDVPFSKVTEEVTGMVGATVDQITSGSFRINVPASGSSSYIYVVIEVQDELDMGQSDILRVSFDKVAPVTGTLGLSLGVSDSDETVNVAWLTKQKLYAATAPVNTAGTTYETVANISSTLPALKSRKPYKRLILNIGLTATGAGALTVNLIQRGGIGIWDVATVATIGTAVRWVNSKGATETYTSPPTRMPDAVVDTMLGTSIHASLPRMGCVAYWRAPYDAKRASEGYDFVEFFVQKSTDSTKWKTVGRVRNSDPVPELLHTVKQSVVDAGASVVTPSNAGPNSSAKLMAIWKNHLVIHDDRKLYFSFSSLPGQFVPPKGEIRGSYDATDEEDLGRTAYVSTGRAVSAKSLVGGEVFYIGTGREVEHMIGDFANSATPPRLLPGSMGVLGVRASALYRNGALMAHERGLWHYNVTRAYSTSGDTPQDDPGFETSLLARKSWTTLFGGSAANMVVATYDDEVWVFNKPSSSGKMMRLTRPLVDGRRDWYEGDWPEVVAAYGWLGRGLRFMASNGKVYRAGTDSTGANYTTDSGTPVNWSMETGEVIAARERCTAIFVEGSGTPVVTVRVWDGLDIPVEETYAMTRAANQEWILDVNLPPGVRHQVQVSGVVGTDSVRKLVMRMEPMGEGFGN